jgi:hypothetical protein
MATANAQPSIDFLSTVRAAFVFSIMIALAYVHFWIRLERPQTSDTNRQSLMPEEATWNPAVVSFRLSIIVAKFRVNYLLHDHFFSDSSGVVCVDIPYKGRIRSMYLR